MFAKSIAGLEIVEFGEASISRSPFGQGEVYAYLKDPAGKYYIFSGSIGNFGIAFNLYPYDPSAGGPNMKDLLWLEKWTQQYYDDVGPELRKKSRLILSKQDYNMVSSVLGYGILKERKCDHCGKASVADWWFANGCLCTACMQEVKDAFTFMY